MKKDKQILIKQTPGFLAELYDKYGAMLLGYIYDIVKDRKLAEQCLITIYSSLSVNYKDAIPDGENAWCYLQRLTRKYLSNFNCEIEHAVNVRNTDFKLNDRNKFLMLMTYEQRAVFCGIYHDRKTISQLSEELNNCEDFIRKTLKEGFAIIKRAS